MNIKVKGALINYFTGQKDILCVYLFGSSATGRENRFSDIDIAVLFSSEVLEKQYTRKSLLIVDDLSRILDKDVDAVVLNKAASFLKFQVIKDGVRIYEHQRRRSRDFEARAIMEYFDFLPVRKKLEAALISSIKEA